MERAAPKREHFRDVEKKLMKILDMKKTKHSIILSINSLRYLKKCKIFMAPNPFHNVKPQEELVKIK